MGHGDSEWHCPRPQRSRHLLRSTHASSSELSPFYLSCQVCKYREHYFSQYPLLFTKKKNPTFIFRKKNHRMNKYFIKISKWITSINNPTSTPSSCETNLSSKYVNKGTSLVVQWLRIHLAMQGDMGLISGQGTKIPKAMEQLSPHTITRESLHYS